jgi:aminopeptidase-like protein
VNHFLQKRNLSKKKNKNAFISDYSKSIIDYMSYADGSNNIQQISNILKKNYSKMKDLSKTLENQKLIKIY